MTVAVADVAAVAAALRDLAPPGVVTGALAVDPALVAELRPDEAALVAAAVDKRRNEFATGRALLRHLIGSERALLRAPSGAPVLPDGWRASLAHDRHVAVAAASRDPAVRALGVDVEPDTPLASELAAVILRDDERGIDAHLAFALKEAAYKAWSTLGGAFLEHHDVRLDVAAAGSFRACVLSTGTTFPGRYAHAGGRLLALVAV